MTITYRTRQFPKDVLITSVHCAICRRFVTTGQYTVAPASSIYAGKPICGSCIDLAPPGVVRGIGPSERKAVEPSKKKIVQGLDSPDGKWHLDILDSSPD